MLRAIPIVSLSLVFQVCADQCVFGPTIVNSKDTRFGEISSNSEGTNYERNTFCSWKFELARNEVLRLRSTKFSLGNGFDVVKIRDSAQPSLLFWSWGGFAGDDPQENELACISGSISTTVDFDSSSLETGAGFTLEYEIVKRDADGAFDGCTRTILDDPWHCSEETIIKSSDSTSGSFSSNSAGIDYLNNKKCAWKFELAADEVLQLSSSSFDLGNGHYAVNVQSSTSPSALLFQWGGFAGHDPQENELACISGSIGTTVDFDVGSFRTGPGFTLEYNIVKSNAAGAFDACTRTIVDEPWRCSDEVVLTSANSTSGTVATNSDGIDFLNNAVCTWNFYTSPNEAIGLKIIAFDLDSSFNNVIIRDIDSSVEYENWDGWDLGVVGRTFRSDANRDVSLVFESSSFGRGSGLVMEYTFYKEDCADLSSGSTVQLFEKNPGSKEGCSWLAEQDSTAINSYCSNFGKVRRKCRVICDSCRPNQRSCEDSVKATFPTFTFLAKTCEWLSRRTKAKKKQMCRLNENARQSCPLTCDACP